MSNLTHLFKVGQKVTYRNNDFDAVKRNISCVVKETYPNHIIITDTETDTDLWIEEGLGVKESTLLDLSGGDKSDENSSNG